MDMDVEIWSTVANSRSGSGSACLVSGEFSSESFLLCRSATTVPFVLFVSSAIARGAYPGCSGWSRRGRRL